MITKESQHLSHVLNYCEAAGFTVNWISPRMRTFSASYYLTCAARVHIFNYSCTLCCLSFWIMLYLWTRETWSFYCRAVRRKTLVAFNILCKIFKGSVFVFSRKSHLFNLVKKYLLQELSSEKGACCLCGKLW